MDSEIHFDVNATDKNFSPSFEIPYAVFLTFLLLVVPLLVVGLVVNLLAFLIFYKKPIFRKILSNRLVINLMILNMVSCTLLFPAVIVDITLSSFETFTLVSSSLGICIWSTLLSSLVTNGSILAMLAVGIDQYFAILYPLEYSTKVTHKVSWQLISLVWTLGLIASTLSSLQLIASHSPWQACKTALGDGRALLGSHRAWIAAVNLIICYLIPMALLTFMYLRIFWAARKNSKTVRKQSIAAPSSSLPFSSVASFGGGGAGSHPGMMGMRSHSIAATDDFSGVFDDEIPERRFRRPSETRDMEDSEDVFEEEEDENNKGGISLCLTPKRKEKVKRRKSDDMQLQPGDAPKALDVIVSPKKKVTVATSAPPGSILRRPLSPPFQAFMRGCRPKPPKLSALRARGGAIFSRPVLMTSVDSANSNISNYASAGPGSKLKNHRLANHITRQEEGAGATGGTCSIPSSRHSSQGNDSLSSGGGNGSTTPKRKCSFSSFSECRYLDGEKHQTFLFSIEAPSPPETPPCFEEPEPETTKIHLEINPPTTAPSPARLTPNGTSTSLAVPSDHELISISASQRRRRFSQASLSFDDANGHRKKSSSASSTFSSGDPGVGSSSTNLIDNRGSLNTVVVGAPLSKSASLLSMTSQAARRLSVTVSRRASSVYHSLHAKEEFRTAKISTLVIVLAFVCWTPFFVVLALLSASIKDDNLILSPSTVYYAHCVSNLFAVAFAGASPYVYVFRSEKVQKCLQQLLADAFSRNHDEDDIQQHHPPIKVTKFKCEDKKRRSLFARVPKKRKAWFFTSQKGESAIVTEEEARKADLKPVERNQEKEAQCQSMPPIKPSLSTSLDLPSSTKITSIERTSRSFSETRTAEATRKTSSEFLELPPTPSLSPTASHPCGGKFSQDKQMMLMPLSGGGVASSFDSQPDTKDNGGEDACGACKRATSVDHIRQVSTCQRLDHDHNDN